MTWSKTKDFLPESKKIFVERKILIWWETFPLEFRSAFRWFLMFSWPRVDQSFRWIQRRFVRLWLERKNVFLYFSQKNSIDFLSFLVDRQSITFFYDKTEFSFDQTFDKDTAENFLCDDRRSNSSIWTSESYSFSRKIQIRFGFRINLCHPSTANLRVNSFSQHFFVDFGHRFHFSLFESRKLRSHPAQWKHSKWSARMVCLRNFNGHFLYVRRR